MSDDDATKFDHSTQEEIVRQQARLRDMLPGVFKNDPEIAAYATGPTPTTVDVASWSSRLAQAIRAFFLRQVDE